MTDHATSSLTKEDPLDANFVLNYSSSPCTGGVYLLYRYKLLTELNNVYYSLID